MLPGLPLAGNLLDFRREHAGLFDRGYRRYGRIFGVRLGPQRGVVLIGPEHHRFFFHAVDGLLSVPELYRFVIPMFGEVVMAAPNRDTRRQQVALMQSAFQGRRLDAYAQTMADEVGAWLGGLGRAGTFDLWEACESLSMNIAASTLMGPEVRDRIADFRPLLTDLARGMEFILPPNLPLRRFRRRDRARRLLTEMVEPILARRRAAPGGRVDFLQTLVDDPALRTDATLVGMALCTIFTGYITTAAQMAWALVLLLQNRDYLESVVDELPCERAPRLDWALKEAVRLRPVMSHYARTNAQDYERGGYKIPKGWLTMLCPAVAHRLPEVFENPDAYDPERFGPGREEDRRAYAMIGFSGGFYRCPGSGFGMAEMRVALGMLLARYRLELVDADPPAAFDLGVTRPRSPCRVRYAVR